MCEPIEIKDGKRFRRHSEIPNFWKQQSRTQTKGRGKRDALLALRPTEPVQLEGSALQVPFSREARQLYSEKWQKNSSHPNPKSESVTRTATGRSLGGSVGYFSDRSL